MSLRTPLKNVRRLGSAKNGTHHWWHQRLTAMALLPLVVAFLAYLLALTGADHATVAARFASPWFAIIALLLIFAVFYHARLGLQVVIEDYVHGEGAKLVTQVVMTFAVFITGFACAFSVLKLAFGG